jgi:hypothetical protein
MATKAPPVVRASDGRIGTIVGEGFEKTGDAEGPVDVLLDDGERLLVSPRALVEQGDGSYRLDLSKVEDEGKSQVVVPLVAE